MTSAGWNRNSQALEGAHRSAKGRLVPPERTLQSGSCVAAVHFGSYQSGEHKMMPTPRFKEESHRRLPSNADSRGNLRLVWTCRMGGRNRKAGLQDEFRHKLVQSVRYRNTASRSMFSRAEAIRGWKPRPMG